MLKETIKRILVKLTSTKLWITLWSLFLISYITFTNLVAFNNLALALVVIPTSYFVANEIQKRLN